MTPTPDAPAARKGGPPGWFIVLAIGSLVVAMILVLLPMLGVGVRVGSAPTMAPTSDAAARTHTMVVSALQAAGFQVEDPLSAYRPGESPMLATAPRRLVRANLPDDPQNGYVVIYELASPTDADAAGREFLAFSSKGQGVLAYPRDAQFVVQRVGSTLVFFTWSPEVSPTGGAAKVAAALGTVGEPARP